MIIVVKISVNGVTTIKDMILGVQDKEDGVIKDLWAIIGIEIDVIIEDPQVENGEVRKFANNNFIRDLRGNWKKF